MSTEGLVYSFVGKGGVVLAEYSAYSGNFSKIAMKCLRKLPSNSKNYTFSQDGHTFNFLFDSGFVFLLVADESIGLSIPSVFLERVKDDFRKCYGGSISSNSTYSYTDDGNRDDYPSKERFSIDYSLDSEFGPRLKEHMQYFMNHMEEISRQFKSKAPMTEDEGVTMDKTDTTVVMKVKLGCCELCPKKVERALSKLTGVSSVDMDTEENLISVSGTVDTHTLRKTIYAETGKTAKVVSYGPRSTDFEEKMPKNTDTGGDAEPENQNNSQQKEKFHKNCSCCGDGNDPKKGSKMHKNCCCCCCGDGNSPKKENDVHKCEPYEGPPEIKDFVCRDYFCKVHPRSRKITDQVSEKESTIFGYLPDYTQWYYSGSNPWYPIRRSYSPMWYSEQPPPRYGLYQPPRRRHPFGFY